MTTEPAAPDSRFIPANLDEMMTVEECAAWLRINRRELLVKSRGKHPRIPAVRVGRTVIRFHPRTILAKMARDAGVPEETIRASLLMT